MTKPDVGISPDRESAADVPPFPSIAGIFQAHYADVARLAAMLGADDPEDVAQEANANAKPPAGMLGP